MLSSDEYSFRFDAGVSMPSNSVKIEDKEKITICIAKHFLIYVCKGELDQLKSGMQHLGVLDLMFRHSALLGPLLTVSGIPQLTSSVLLELFNVDWSPEGSNQREIEEAVILNWTEYVRELESKYIYMRLIL